MITEIMDECDAACNTAISPESQNTRWSNIIDMLSVYGNPEGASARAPKSATKIHAKHRDGQRNNAVVTLIDRPSPRSVVMSWRDSTGSSYGYQVWEKRLAIEESHCAVSGDPVHIGDTVFRLVDRGLHPGNEWAVILATCIDRMKYAKDAVAEETVDTP